MPGLLLWLCFQVIFSRTQSTFFCSAPTPGTARQSPSPTLTHHVPLLVSTHCLQSPRAPFWVLLCPTPSPSRCPTPLLHPPLERRVWRFPIQTLSCTCIAPTFYQPDGSSVESTNLQGHIIITNLGFTVAGVHVQNIHFLILLKSMLSIFFLAWIGFCCCK